MKYSEFEWNEDGVAVVYVETIEERESFVRAFSKAHPDFRTQIFDFILNYKKPFLQKDRTIVDFLVYKTPKHQQAEVEQKIRRYVDRLDLSQLQYRKPNAMGASSMYTWTLLADALWGQDKFLVWDDGKDSRSRAVKMLTWLKEYRPSSVAVWLTCCPEMDVVADGEALSLPCRYWKAAQGSLTELDYAELLAKKQADEAERRARWEAEMAQKAELAALLESEGKLAEALAIYDAISEEGWVPAMVPAARLYFDEKGTGDFLEQWKKAEALCRRANTAEGWILLGDRAVKAAKSTQQAAKNHDMEKLDEHEKYIVVDHLRDAADYYRRAAGLDSAEGCYKAAKLHLQYTFSRESTSSWENFSYTQEDAIPYIEQLIAMKEDGRAGVDYYVLELHWKNNEYYKKALAAYQNKK